MMRKILAALVAALLLGALAGCSSDDSGSDEATSEDAEASSTTEEATDEEPADDEPADDEDKAEPEAKRLVDQLSSSGALGDGEIDPDLEECMVAAVLEDDDLMALVEESADIDPTSPEFETLLTVLLDCGGREYMEAAFEEGMAGSEASADQQACVQDYVTSLSDEEFVAFIMGAANEDESVLEPLMECMLME